MPTALLQTQPPTQIGKPWQKGVTPEGAKPWKPGQSGNPSGKGGKFVEAQTIARKASPKAAQVLVEMLDDNDPRVRGYAADKIREWAWGKIPDYDPKAEHAEALPVDPSQFTPAQRVMIRSMLQLLLSASVPE